MTTVAAGTIIASKYLVEQPLARGGMGSVWVGRHLQLGAPVAVKFMGPDVAASEDARARFAREAKAAAQIQSPHVVKVFDYGVDEGTPYMVMELLRGEHLGARLGRSSRLSLPAAARVVGELCKGLTSAHELGIVHRDLKPSNVFLARVDEAEITKILDFGIAKASRGGALAGTTLTGSMMGSPHYMSPEQARDSKRVDARSDLWSLGVIAFRALTGALPFPGREAIEILMKVCAEPFQRPSSIVPELGAEVDRFFERALSRDRAERFQSAREMARAFSALRSPVP